MLLQLLVIASYLLVSDAFVSLSPRSLGSRRLALYASSEEWIQGTLKSNMKDGEGLKSIEIEVPPEISSNYKTPGQYVKLKIGENKPNFFAIASPPDGRDTLSFLVKETDSNEFLTCASVDQKFDLSVPQGKGFQFEEYFENYKSDWACSNVYLLAAGSGLAPIAACIDFEGLGLGSTGTKTLFPRKAILIIGARSEQHLPFRNKYEEWKAKGVEVIPVLSKGADDWTGRRGYVQDVLKEDKVKVPRNSAALMCGQRDMTDNCRELLLDAGVFEGRILLNF